MLAGLFLSPAGLIAQLTAKTGVSGRAPRRPPTDKTPSRPVIRPPDATAFTDAPPCLANSP